MVKWLKRGRRRRDVLNVSDSSLTLTRTFHVILYKFTGLLLFVFIILIGPWIQVN